MDNQHRQIKGYRELNQREIDLMNQIKAKGAELDTLIGQVQSHLAEQATKADTDKEECARLDLSQPGRWAAIGRTHFQEGLMALTRAVAQPTFF